MPHGMISILWHLWISKVIQIDTIIRALALEDYELGSITKEGITVFKENERFEFRYGKRD